MDKISFDKTDLFNIASTQTEASDLINNLSALQEVLFNTKISLEKKLDNYLSFSQKEKVISLCKKYSVDINDESVFEKFLITLKEAIANIPLATLRLAFEPTSSFIDEISDWLVSSIKKHFLIEVIIDPKIIGGAIITSKGIYIDLSIKKDIEEKIKRGEIQLTTIPQ